MKRVVRASSSFRAVNYEGQGYGVRITSFDANAKDKQEFASSLKLQVTETHPYDYAEYAWCKVQNGYAKFVQDGRVVCKAFLLDYLDELNEYNATTCLGYVVRSVCATLIDINEDVEPCVSWD